VKLSEKMQLQAIRGIGKLLAFGIMGLCLLMVVLIGAIIVRAIVWILGG